jgi:hypothetical protein
VPARQPSVQERGRTSHGARRAGRPSQAGPTDRIEAAACGPDADVAIDRSDDAALDGSRLDAGGTRLRIRALHVMGHCSARIARAAGTSDQAIQQLARGSARTVTPLLRDAIAAIYEQWWDKRPPETSQPEKAAAAAARRRAARGNWCAGAGLDDDLLDQPGYQPHSGWKPARGTGTAGAFTGTATNTKGSYMSCDPRHSAVLVTDILAVLHRHGYHPGDRTHTARAVR